MGTYGVLKLPVISNFLPSPTVTVLMTMLEAKLLADLMRMVLLLVNMELYKDASKNNFYNNKCNNKNSALHKEELMFRTARQALLAVYKLRNLLICPQN